MSDYTVTLRLTAHVEDGAVGAEALPRYLAGRAIGYLDDCGAERLLRDGVLTFEPVEPAEPVWPAERQQVFVAHPDGTFTCESCTPPQIDLADPEVEVWEVGSSGWTGKVTCSRCCSPLPVLVDGIHV